MVLHESLEERNCELFLFTMYGRINWKMWQVLVCKIEHPLVVRKRAQQSNALWILPLHLSWSVLCPVSLSSDILYIPGSYGLDSLKSPGSTIICIFFSLSEKHAICLHECWDWKGKQVKGGGSCRELIFSCTCHLFCVYVSCVHLHFSLHVLPETSSRCKGSSYPNTQRGLRVCSISLVWQTQPSLRQ